MEFKQTQRELPVSGIAQRRSAGLWDPNRTNPPKNRLLLNAFFKFKLRKKGGKAFKGPGGTTSGGRWTPREAAKVENRCGLVLEKNLFL